MQQDSNGIGNALKVIGIIEIGLAVIASFIIGTNSGGSSDFNIVTALIWWISGIVGGMFFIGFGEVISLLQRILNRLSSNVNENPIKEEDIDGKVFNSIVWVSNNQSIEGILAISNKNLKFYTFKFGEGTSTLHHVSMSSITKITSDDTVKDQLHILIQYKNEGQQQENVRIFSEKNSISIGDEMLNMIVFYCGELKKEA